MSFRDRIKGPARVAAAELIRADAAMLAVMYADGPIPFWPFDYPTVLEGVPRGAAPLPEG